MTPSCKEEPSRSLNLLQILEARVRNSERTPEPLPVFVRDRVCAHTDVVACFDAQGRMIRCTPVLRHLLDACPPGAMTYIVASDLGAGLARQRLCRCALVLNRLGSRARRLPAARAPRAPTRRPQAPHVRHRHSERARIGAAFVAAGCIENDVAWRPSARHFPERPLTRPSRLSPRSCAGRRRTRHGAALWWTKSTRTPATRRRRRPQSPSAASQGATTATRTSHRTTTARRRRAAVAGLMRTALARPAGRGAPGTFGPRFCARRAGAGECRLRVAASLSSLSVRGRIVQERTHTHTHKHSHAARALRETTHLMSRGLGCFRARCNTPTHTSVVIGSGNGACVQMTSSRGVRLRCGPMGASPPFTASTSEAILAQDGAVLLKPSVAFLGWPH